jgi:transcriptional regulator with XRE-family HTH domain
LSPRKIGVKIKRLRTKKGLTQAALAKKVGVSRVHLANLESPDSAAHHRTPSLALLDKLAKALGVKVSELVD